MASPHAESFSVTLTAGSLRADTGAGWLVPHVWTDGGVVVEAAPNGAGVLHVDMNEFMFAQLPSMVVAEGVDPVRPRPGMPSRDRPEAVDPARAAWAVGKFAVFFFGSLQRVYAPELGSAIGTFFGLSEGSRPQ